MQNCAHCWHRDRTRSVRLVDAARQWTSSIPLSDIFRAQWQICCGVFAVFRSTNNSLCNLRKASLLAENGKRLAPSSKCKIPLGSISKSCYLNRISKRESGGKESHFRISALFPSTFSATWKIKKENLLVISSIAIAVQMCYFWRLSQQA